MNRLQGATSPYLLQHAENPVDWWPWCNEAFVQARQRDVPVLLSIGYSACHWCHVMAHESFEDNQIAALMNDQFVCIKVDREERPDVDAVYMKATVAMTGQGGWPLTAFLTPDGAPFYCGTYFPPVSRGGLPSFHDLLLAVPQAWQHKRDDVVKTGQQLVQVLSATEQANESVVLGQSQLDSAVASLGGGYDAEHGGFGAAPKFPPSMCLEFLLRHHANTGDAASLAMVERTCEKMARGGIYDQLAGGFARYSVDGAWVVPHFEKMLYDNALLARVYLHLWRETGKELPLRIAVETVDFIIRDLATNEGGFASALDADTDGVEGATYVWTQQQLMDVLGTEDGIWAAELLSVTTEGTFDDGASTLQLRSDPVDMRRWDKIRSHLREVRLGRAQPTRDDKIVAAWNGLAIAVLAEAGSLLNRQSYVDAAIRCAELLLDVHLNGSLSRTSRDGNVGQTMGVLEDYGDLAEGLLALHQATGEPRWLTSAGQLLDFALEHFSNGQGGFYDTAEEAEQLITRPSDPTDNATPSGQSALVAALLTYAALTGSTGHRVSAEQALDRASSLIAQQPRFAGWWGAAAEAALAGPLQIAVVGDGELSTVARRSTSPGAVVAIGAPDTPGVHLLASRPYVDGQSAAYVCREFVCDAPITKPDVLAVAIRARLE